MTSQDQLYITLLVVIGVGYYIFWYWTGKHNARRLRKKAPETTHEEFVRDPLLEKNKIPCEYTLAFLRFFEDSYGLKGGKLIAPTMTLNEISSISPYSPLADDIEVSYLLKKLDTLDSNAERIFQEGSIAEIILACWKVGIDSPHSYHVN